MRESTFFKWRGKYAGATANDVKRLRELEAEIERFTRSYRTDILHGSSSLTRTLVTHDSARFRREAAARFFGHHCRKFRAK